MSGDNEYSWTVRLADRDRRKLYGIALVALVAGAFGWLMLHHPLGLIVGVAMILGATAEFWMSAQYRLDETGATAKLGLSVTSIEWNAVKRVIECPDGVKLSPLDSDGRLSPFRGVFLRFDANQTLVMARIESQVGNECRNSGTKI